MSPPRGLSHRERESLLLGVCIDLYIKVWPYIIMGLLSNMPLGFAEAVAMLNALPQSLLAEIVREYILYISTVSLTLCSVKM